MESDRKAIEHRFGLVLKDNERFKADLNYLRNDIAGKETTIIQVTNELEDLKFNFKKTQAELSRATSQLKEITLQKTSLEEGLKQENDKLAAREKALKAQLKEVDIKLSEEQGTLDITKIKLTEREERIKHIERLLSETVEHSKVLSTRAGEL
jgi:chromosome segregation ATPase